MQQPQRLPEPAALRAAEGALLPAAMPQFLDRLAGAPEVDDAELVRRATAGDQDAFAALVARYQKRAFWIAFHALGRVEDARDVAQEAFVRLFRSLHRFDFARSFYTWFYRIVMNLAIDQLRKHRSSRAASLEEWQDGMAGPDGDSSAPVQRAEQDQQVWRVLDRLDAKFRAVLVLRDIHGLGCREIAPILRVTHATVRWRLHRGRQLFKEQWQRVAAGGVVSGCRRVQTALPEFVAGELAAPAAAATRRHLQDCQRCRQQASQHLQARQALRSAAGPAGVDEAFFRDLHGSVMRQIAGAAVAADPARGAPGRGRRLIGVAAGFALFGLGVWFVQAGRPAGSLERALPAAPAIGLPVPLPYASTPVLRELGLAEAPMDGAGPAVCTQGMMGRALLRRLVEVDLLGLGTLVLETGSGAEEPRPPAGQPR